MIAYKSKRSLMFGPMHQEARQRELQMRNSTRFMCRPYYVDCRMWDRNEIDYQYVCQVSSMNGSRYPASAASSKGNRLHASTWTSPRMSNFQSLKEIGGDLYLSNHAVLNLLLTKSQTESKEQHDTVQCQI